MTEEELNDYMAGVSGTGGSGGSWSMLGAQDRSNWGQNSAPKVNNDTGYVISGEASKESNFDKFLPIFDQWIGAIPNWLSWGMAAIGVIVAVGWAGMYDAGSTELIFAAIGGAFAGWLALPLILLCTKVLLYLTFIGLFLTGLFWIIVWIVSLIEAL